MEKRYEEEIKAFGKRLRELRKSLKMTQLDIEVKTGIQRSEISKIENGQNNIEFFTIVKLADALDIELYQLFIPD